MTSKIKHHDHGMISFECPACRERVITLEDGTTIPLGSTHVVRVDPSSGSPCWEFTGPDHAPTLSPSVRVQGTHGDGYVCHFFVRRGQIHYCSDCTHAMAGQVVDMPAIEVNT